VGVRTKVSSREEKGRFWRKPGVWSMGPRIQAPSRSATAHSVRRVDAVVGFTIRSVRSAPWASTGSIRSAYELSPARIVIEGRILPSMPLNSVVNSEATLWLKSSWAAIVFADVTRAGGRAR
jgi:hypothetical protein